MASESSAIFEPSGSVVVNTWQQQPTNGFGTLMIPVDGNQKSGINSPQLRLVVEIPLQLQGFYISKPW